MNNSTPMPKSTPPLRVPAMTKLPTGLLTHTRREESAFRAVTFRAWKLGTTDQAYPVEIEADTPDEALNAALANGGLNHKDRLFILHTDAGRGKAWLHAWAFKRKSQPRYVRGPDMTSRPVYDLYPAELFTMAVDAFEPTRPFDALRDDPRGIDLTLVEAKS